MNSITRAVSHTRRLALAASVVLIGSAAACGGAAEKEVTSKGAGTDDPVAKDVSSAVKSAAARTFPLVFEGAPERITVGETASGTLDGTDLRMGDGSFVDLWLLQIDAPTEVVIELTSSAFDTYLGIGTEDSSGFYSLSQDDDGGTGTNSRIRIFLEPGVYSVLANSFSAGEEGAYQLSVQPIDAETTTSASSGGLVEAGGRYDGRLEGSDETLPFDGSYIDRWTFSGQAGEILTVVMRSDQFDSYLLLGEAVGSDVAIGIENDDGGGGLDARIEFELPYTGTFVILANSFSPGETGDYTLEVDVRRATAVNWEQRFPGGGDPNDKYALLVGINDYPGTGSDLLGPVEDAEAMRAVLMDRYDFDPENIVMLTDENATRSAIANAFIRHLGQAGPDGVAVFFYSGHGTQMQGNIGISAPLDPEEDGIDESLYVWGQTSES